MRHHLAVFHRNYPKKGKRPFLLVLFLLPFFSAGAQASLPPPDAGSAVVLVQRQIEAWNRHDAEAFIATYCDTTELYNFPNQLRMRFKDRQHLRDYYTTLFKKNPQLNCEVLNQIAQGNTVILQEKVSGWQKGNTSEAIVIYEVGDGKITKVYFDFKK